MAMYVRHTRSVQLDELPAHIRSKLADNAESRQIQLNGVRAWLTPSENPPASSGLGKLLRRRANSADPDDEHRTVLVLHPTQILVVIDGAKRGTSALWLRSLQRANALAAQPPSSIDTSVTPVSPKGEWLCARLSATTPAHRRCRSDAGKLRTPSGPWLMWRMLLCRPTRRFTNAVTARTRR